MEIDRSQPAQELWQPDRGVLTPDEIRQESKDRVVVLDNQHDHLYEESPPFHPTFQSVFMALVECNAELKKMNLAFDPTMAPSEDKKHFHVGVIRQDLPPLKIVLNWTPSSAGSIPPRHMAILWYDQTIGILGPYADRRRCWQCGLEQFQYKGKTYNVLPGYPCPRSACNSRDWLATIVTQENVVEAAATWMARYKDDDKSEALYDRYGRMAQDEIAHQPKEGDENE